jgi:CubicO group peptidase (beta-lactamase class C family)
LKNKWLIVFSLLFSLQATNAQTNNTFKTDIENLAQSLKLPTLAVGVAKGDSLIFFEGIGSASVETKIHITADHIFGIASVTKSFTSIVLQQLEAEGKISVADPVDKYPNKYFTKARWTDNTTLAHIVSQTSESRPVGSNFVYNGSKYNIVFNVFSKINPPVENESMTRPFTREIESRVLKPLNMTHTLVRYAEAEHAALKQFVVTPYDFDYSEKKYKAQKVDLSNLECGPGYGMLTSVNDLLKYSRGLDNETILSKERYRIITSPFYPGSVYGQGWFTTNFEGHKMFWAYGLGGSDAAIFLKVPSKNLTLVILSSCSLLTGTTRLGFGNPLNSPFVCSFIRNFVLNQPNTTPYDEEANSIANEIVKRTKESKSRVFIEEAFAKVSTSIFSPLTSDLDKEKNTELLKVLIEKFPNDAIWYSATAFELMSSLANESVTKFAAKISKEVAKEKNPHPAKLFYAGVINEKVGNTTEAIRLFQKLADGEAYNEQGYKFDAMMKLAKYFEKSNPELTKYYLENLIRFKEYIATQDDQYKAAKAMLENAR